MDTEIITSSSSPETAATAVKKGRPKKAGDKIRAKKPRRASESSQKAQKQLASQIPTSQLTVESYADRPNPELSWAAAILKRTKSTERQRKKAAEIMSRAGTERAGKKLSQFWQSMTPEQKRELAARGGRRRWEIWREEQAALHGNTQNGDSQNSPGEESA